MYIAKLLDLEAKGQVVFTTQVPASQSEHARHSGKQG